MADKFLNPFYESVAKYVNLSSQEEEWIASSWRAGVQLYTPSIIANSQRTPTGINKDGAIAKVRILVEQMII